jgi:hypothetical protein
LFSKHQNLNLHKYTASINTLTFSCLSLPRSHVSLFVFVTVTSNLKQAASANFSSHLQSTSSRSSHRFTIGLAMTKSKYRSKTTAPNKDEPHRGGGSWQDVHDRQHIAKYQAEYEAKTARRKGKEVVRACAQTYVKAFEGRLKSQFNVRYGYPEAGPITDPDGWKAFIEERTDVCSFQSILYSALIACQQIENALRCNVNSGPGKAKRGIRKGASSYLGFEPL